ncbi:MAG: hypothetical protein KatS3mg081_0927 [Gemmatimonadales bacterium]|nr:MAG: hypothetical protein KatS3mg081_0927 [Gemmatimonadales bacterium]
MSSSRSIPKRRGALRAPAAALAAFLAACGSEPAGTVDFDAAGLYQSVAPVAISVEGSPATQTLGVLGQKISIDSAPPPYSIGGPSGSTAPAGLFPQEILGKTFEYDPASRRYRLSDRPVVPELENKGVRFLLYQVDPALRDVVSPLRETGFADLTDESSTSSKTLGVKAVIDAQTLLDYDAGATTTSASFTLSAGGFVSDGSTVIDFEITQTFSQAGIETRYLVAAPEKDVSLEFQGSISLGGQTSVKLTVLHGGNTTVIEASGTQGSITGTITHNGTRVINIAGTSDNPVFTSPSGASVRADQAEALRRLFGTVDQLLSAFDDLLVPAYGLLNVPV